MLTPSKAKRSSGNVAALIIASPLRTSAYGRADDAYSLVAVADSAESLGAVLSRLLVVPAAPNGRHRQPGVRFPFGCTLPFACSRMRQVFDRPAEPLRGVRHISVCSSGRIIGAILLARRSQLCQSLIEILAKSIRRLVQVRSIGGVKRQRRWPRKRCAHQDHGTKDVRSRY
jgi:hypothetical protein